MQTAYAVDKDVLSSSNFTMQLENSDTDSDMHTSPSTGPDVILQGGDAAVVNHVYHIIEVHRDIPTKAVAETVLRIPELVNEIALVVNRHDLLSLAMVASFTFPGAIEILWRRLPSPLPLFLLFSSLSYLDHQWTLQELPSAQEWERFDFYASFVHSIFSFHSSQPPGLHDINPNVYSFLHQRLPTRPILPQLRSLVLRPIPFPGEPWPLRPLLTPQLHTVRLDLPSYTTSFMQDLLSLCPYVSNLHLQGCLMQRDLDDIPHFRFLKHFTIAPYKSRNNSPTTPQAAAVLLLKFPTSLSSLRLQGTHIAEFRLLPPLPTITEVHLCGSTSFISESLKMLPYLVKVSLEFSDSQATSRDIIPALKSIASMSKTTLRYLKYVTGANVLVRDTLAPLFNIPYLQSLAILKRNIRVLDITDGDLRQMVVAWPDLSSLTLPVNVQTSHLSLNSLRTLSTLKNVEYILLQVNNFVVELPLGHFTRDSIISPVVKVYLQRLFPSLFSF